MKKRILALILVTVTLLSLVGCHTVGPDSTTGETQSFTLKVIHGDGSTFETAVETDKKTVGEALVEAGLIDGKQDSYGLFVETVDKETADGAKEQWWCLTKGGQNVNTGVDSTPVEAGATYEFTLTTGY